MLASSGWGGAERLACTLVRMAEGAGHHVEVDHPGAPGIDAGLRRELGRGGRGGEDSLLRWVRAARLRARDFQPDLVHAHLSWPSLASAVTLIAGRVPLLLTFHLLPEAWPRDRLLRLRTPAAFELLRRFGAPRLVTTVSATDLQRVRAALPRDRVELVRNAAPLPPLVSDPVPPVEWAPGAVRLLSVARISRRKGFERLARALAAPGVRDLPWHWLIVGDGEDRAALEALVTEQGIAARVTFAGARSAYDLIATAELVISPSHAEGMPLVPLEAISCGVPVIASRIPAHEELLGAGARGLLPGDESEWPAALAKLVSHEAARAEVLSEQTALVTEFGRARMWERYAALYEEHGRA